MKGANPLTGVRTPSNVLYMETTTIALSKTADRVAVIVNGETLGTVKDGGQIVHNADKILKGARVLRASGYSLEGSTLVAHGVRL